jgi:aminoglycoside phosphotransferase (APT) family kinase protein
MNMNKTSLAPSTTLLTSPANFHTQTGEWFSLPNSDPITDYMIANLWDLPEQPECWQVARLSPAAYIYREQTTGWAIVAKFHTAKTGADAERHAAREYQYIRQAWEVGAAEKVIRAIRPLSLWRGALFLEYVNGLTLEDKIAIRRSQPGELSPILENMGRFLASLHVGSVHHETGQDFGQAADYAYKLVDNLARHGVLQNNPIAQNGFGRVIEKWAANPLMWDFDSTQNHGDATTTNFIFPRDGGGVAIDWERSKYDDPAADLGRLVAEVTHCVNHHGGSVAEALSLIQKITNAYCNNLPSDWNTEALLRRSRFYQATSTLRIARNGWLSRQDRMVLVIQALALLS